MKVKNIGRIFLVTVIVVLAMCRTVSAQTYSGYLKLDDTSINGPDSLLVTISIPKDTYVRDTVYLKRSEYRDMMKKSRYSPKPYYATPWMMGLKTNLLSDAIAIPYAGLEFQISRHLSLDLNGWFSRWNIFYPNKQTNIYGLAPELRWWLGDRAMIKGYFVGLHANAGWYTLEWKDKDGNKVLYQNGLDDLDDFGATTPAWSAGLTYGFSQPLDRKAHWNLEFYMGIGYSSYQQKLFYSSEDGGQARYKHEAKTDFGVTKVGINLTYRFSLRRYKANR